MHNNMYNIKKLTINTFPLVFNFCSNVKAIQKLNETELKLGLDTKGSWHEQYKDSAYTFVGQCC